jgi:hypothetical protein
MDLREDGWGGVEWIHLAQDRNRWRAVVSAVMNLRVLVPRSELVWEWQVFLVRKLVTRSTLSQRMKTFGTIKWETAQTKQHIALPHYLVHACTMTMILNLKTTAVHDFSSTNSNL